MADWSLLKSSSGGDFLSSLSHYGNRGEALSQLQMMNSFIEKHSFTHTTNGYDENTFCTPDNVDECITHLNQELTGLGLQPVSHDSRTSTSSLVNRLEELVRLHQRSGRIKEELENRLHRSSCDASDNQSVIRRLKCDKERLEKEVAQECEKHRQAHNKIKHLSSKLKSEKEELRRLQSVIKDRDGQYKHELKKKQREINRLMEKLHTLLVDKNPDRRIGMDMVGYLHRTDSKRGTWKTHNNSSSKQEEMYQVLIGNYEEKQQELRVENSDLRDCLMDMQRELASLLDHSNTTLAPLPAQGERLSGSSSDDEEEDLSTGSSLSHDLNDDCFQMPYDLLRETLQKNFQDICKRLREAMTKHSNIRCSAATSGQCSPSKSQATPPAGSNSNNSSSTQKDSDRKQEELDKLKKQIENYKGIVKEQEKLIQQSLCTQSKSMENTFLQESQILQERESLSEQRRKFYQEKANFEEERRLVTENARLLKQERKQLEEEKSSLLQSQLFQMSASPNSSVPSAAKPPTPPRSRGEKTRLLPSTPVFSPAPGKTPAPSNLELLKYFNQAKQKSLLKSSVSVEKQPISISGSAESLTSGGHVSSHSTPTRNVDHQKYSSGPSRRLPFQNSADLSMSPSGSLKNLGKKTFNSSGLHQCLSFDSAECQSGSEQSSVYENETTSVLNRDLSLEELENIKRSLVRKGRRSSTGSFASADGKP